MLYFVDGVRATIELVRVDMTTEGRMRKTILQKKTLSKPRGLAVHPSQGYNNLFSVEKETFYRILSLQISVLH